LKALTKPQYVDQIPKALKKKEGDDRSVGNLIKQRCEVDDERLDEIAETLGMIDLNLTQEMWLTTPQS